MQTIQVAGGDPTLMQWVVDHGHDPADFTTQVDLDDDGTVTLHRKLRGDDGTPLVVADEVCPTCGRGGEDLRIVTEPVVVTPTRLFPIPVGA